MKKFMKVCGITALILLLAGIVLGAVASTMRGRTAIARVVETVTGGRVNIDFDGFWGWGNQVRDDIEDRLPDVDYDIDDATSFDSHYDILGPDVPKFCLGEEVEKLEVEAGGCSFRTLKSEDASFYVEASDTGRFQAYVEDGTLYVRAATSTRSLSDWGKCEVRLYVPEGFYFREVDIEFGAGLLEFEGLRADRVTLGVGAGQITVDGLAANSLEAEIGMGQMELKGLEVKSLDADIGMGELVARGSVNGDVDVSCSMGNVDMEITGRQEDFNYELTGAMGNIDLGAAGYSGLGMSKTIDNGADKNMEVECSAGNITIKFTD